jgi:hypothetical protein
LLESISGRDFILKVSSSCNAGTFSVESFEISETELLSFAIPSWVGSDLSINSSFTIVVLADVVFFFVCAPYGEPSTMLLTIAELPLLLSSGWPTVIGVRLRHVAFLSVSLHA